MYGDLAMSLLDQPEAQALLADAEVSAGDVRGCRDHITRFLNRYLPLFYRQEQRGHAAAFVRGLLSGLERKSAEPIAYQAGIPRKDLQYFVGCGAWDDETVLAELRRHAREELADDDGVIVLDPSGFPKKGTHSCGVARQWCGRLGKKENCQLGVFLAYISAQGHAPLDRRLYLPKDWADDPVRREACHVPEDVTYRKTWEIAHDLLRRSGPSVPHGWVVGDDEFGRASEFRAHLRSDGERYVLDVPCNTTVRDLGGRRPPRKKGKKGPKRKVPFVRVDSWARKLPADRWTRLTVRDGAKGPREVEAVTARVLRQAGPTDRTGGAAAGDPHGGARAGMDLLPERRLPRRAPGRTGAGAVVPTPDRGGVPAGQGGGGSGALRGPQLGRLAPPCHARVVGLVVPGPGATAARGGKPRR